MEIAQSRSRRHSSSRLMAQISSTIWRSRLVVRQILGGLAVLVLGDVIHLRSVSIVTDREVVLGTVTAGAFASRLTTPGSIAEAASRARSEGRDRPNSSTRMRC